MVSIVQSMSTVALSQLFNSSSRSIAWTTNLNKFIVIGCLYQHQCSTITSLGKDSMYICLSLFNQNVYSCRLPDTPIGMDSIYVCLSIFNQSVYGYPVPHVVTNCWARKQDFHRSWSWHQICSLLLLSEPHKA